MNLKQYKKDLANQPEPLSDYEIEIADYIAKNIDSEPAHSRGLYIWDVCHNHFGYKNHKKIARHLGSRRKRR